MTVSEALRLAVLLQTLIAGAMDISKKAEWFGLMETRGGTSKQEQTYIDACNKEQRAGSEVQQRADA